MARFTGFLAADFSQRILEAKDLAQVSEAASTFTYTRRLFIYEASYLLAFSAWENFLEQAFLRFLCGYSNSVGALVSCGAHPRPQTLTAAHLLVLNGQNFKLWHGPNLVVNRSKLFFTLGPHETVLMSALADIESFAAIRHFVAHRNHDTSVKFQLAATALSGSPVFGGRAGRFLRNQTTDPVTGLNVNWLDRICTDLERYAAQIAS